MIHIVSLMGYGDSLITLSLIERAADAGKVRVLGSGVTEAVSALMRGPSPAIEVLLSSTASFYVVGEKGYAAAMSDALEFRRWARSTLREGDTLVFEKSGHRHRILTLGLPCNAVQIPRDSTAYRDREARLRPYLGAQTWPASASANAAARSVLINPAARAEARMLPLAMIEAAVRLASEAGAEVSLIDMDGRYEALRPRVTNYLRSPPLNESAAALRAADRYLGPDSFFMHLAYYFAVPQLAVFHPEDVYFAPPGLFEQNQYLFFGDAQNPRNLHAKLRRLMGMEARAAIADAV